MLSALFVSAQNDVKVRFGVEAGYNMSKWDGDYKDMMGATFKPGFNLGGLAEIQVNQLWSIQPELLISMEGTKTDGRVLSFGQNKEANMNGSALSIQFPDVVDAWYIKVPIFAYYNFNHVGPGRLSPGLGIYLGWAFAGKTEDVGTFADDSYFRTAYNFINEDHSNYPQDYSEEDEKNLDLLYNCIPRSFDYGVGCKVTYEMVSKVPGLFACLGVTEGLTGAYNLNLQFSIGYKWQYCKWLRSKYNTGILEYNP